MKYVVGLGLALCLCAVAYAGLIWWVYLKDTGPEPDTLTDIPEVEIIQLHDGFFVLEGAGGHITVLTGPDGVLLVDSGDIGTDPQVLAALETLGASDVVYVINTHSHGDHRGGMPPSAAWVPRSSPIATHMKICAPINIPW